MNTLTGLKRKGAIFCVLMKARLFFWGLGAADSLSDDPQTLNSSHSTLKTVKHVGTSNMIWGMFLILCVGPIYRIPGTMDQFEYIQILKEVMLPYAKENIPLKWVFQKDTTPKNTSKRAASWFQTNKINVME